METKITPYEPDWFKLRVGSFTASEIWKLMTEPRSKSETISKTAETYIISKVWETLSGLTQSGIDNVATSWGTEQESHALKWYAKLSGNRLSDPYLIIHNDIEGFMCTPDSFVNDDGLVEVKSPFNGANHLKHCFITTDEYFKKEHPEYYWQCQCQIFLTGRKWCDFVSFDPRIDSKLGMFIYRLEANADDHERLQEKVTKARELFNGYLESFSGEAKKV